MLKVDMGPLFPIFFLLPISIFIWGILNFLFSTLQLKWNRRREGKENETRELNKKVESSSQSCSQSKLEAINRARELDISIAHVNTQLQDLEKLLRSQYAG